MTPFKKDWKYYVGMTFLILACIVPLFGLVVPLLGLPVAISAAIIAVLAFGIPEVMLLLALIFLGKETLAYYKNKALSFFKRKKTLPKPISKCRYYVGLTLFIGSVIPLYLNAYFPNLLPKEVHHLIFACADLIFITSFFILGERFWEKIKSLFVWNA